MPNKNKNQQDPEEVISVNDNKTYRRNLTQLNNILGRANLSLYGTDRTSEVTNLDKKFQDILHMQLNALNNSNDGDVTSFVHKLWSDDRKKSAISQMLDNQFYNSTGSEISSIQSLFQEAYRNKLIEQNDLHEVASALIELTEAINITRDAIISADMVTGRLNRELVFENDLNSDDVNKKSIVESVEKKFNLLNKIKNFIVSKTLEYGEYYAYIIPYSKIFNDFLKIKGSKIKESTLFESTGKSEFNDFTKTQFANFKEAVESSNAVVTEDDMNEKNFSNVMKAVFENIEICNDPRPLPILEEGVSSLTYYMNEYVNESGDSIKTEAKKESKSVFDKVNNDSSSEGIHDDEKEFSDIKDCYIKLIEPTKMIEVKILTTVIGYYYVQEEDITSISGMLTNNLYFTDFNAEQGNKRTMIDGIAGQVVKAFDKKFLYDNVKFKKEIAEALMYHNIQNKRIKFQFIPAEYIIPFKIDEDELGNGQSMIKDSLFYAKLYLMLLLFKIMSIVLYSNDTKVNYIRKSGIDKDIANQIEEIARIKQSRQINIMDLFSYTTLINKIGNGNEQFVPVGRSNERPIETEILQGQDVQLDTPLLEMLKNAYILGTGVPAAILNYLNEAEFAKIVEQNNSKFNARVINYQLDLNESISLMYRKILRYSTTLSQSTIDSFAFKFQPPKSLQNTVKADAIQQHQTLADFLVTLYYGDPTMSADPDINIKIQNFRKKLAEDQLHFLMFETLDKIFEQANMDSMEDKLRPKPSNGDDDLEDELNNMPDEGGEETPPFPM